MQYRLRRRHSTLSLSRKDESLDEIKIDVEGAEAKVLAGSHRIAARRETRFLVEMHSNPELSMRTNATEVLRWCEQVEYDAWLLKERAKIIAAERIEH